MWGLGFEEQNKPSVGDNCTPAVIGITFRGLKLEDEALVLVNRGIAKINYILSSMLEVEAAIEDHKTPKDEPYSAHLHSKF